MIDKIMSVNSISPIQQKGISSIRAPKEKVDFTNSLQDAMSNLIETEKTNADNIAQIALGDLSNINEAMVSIVEADLTLQFTMQVRNKIVDAYKEIMSMQI